MVNIVLSVFVGIVSWTAVKRIGLERFVNSVTLTSRNVTVDIAFGIFDKSSLAEKNV